MAAASCHEDRMPVTNQAMTQYSSELKNTAPPSITPK